MLSISIVIDWHVSHYFFSFLPSLADLIILGLNPHLNILKSEIICVSIEFIMPNALLRKYFLLFYHLRCFFIIKRSLGLNFMIIIKISHQNCFTEALQKVETFNNIFINISLLPPLSISNNMRHLQKFYTLTQFQGDFLRVELIFL